VIILSLQHYKDILDEHLLKEFGKTKRVLKDKKEIKENVVHVLEEDFRKTKAFAGKCVTLSWLMRIKDPPLHMVFKIEYGQPMDTESFKHYTQSGKVMKYVVWPALFL